MRVSYFVKPTLEPSLTILSHKILISTLLVNQRSMVSLPFWIPRSRVRMVLSVIMVIRTLTHRAQTAVTDPEEKTKELDHIKVVLSRCGYHQLAFDPADSQSNTSADKKIRPQSDQPGPSKKKKHLLHPLVCRWSISETSKSVQVLRCRYFLLGHTPPSGNYSPSLPRTSSHWQTMCLWTYSCKPCTATFIGQTSRQLGQRIKEHKSAAPSRIPYAVKDAALKLITP